MVSLVFVTGAQWSVLQSVAWVSMVAEFSETDSFEEAITKTFNGKNPCKLCILVKKGKASEHETDSINPTHRLDFWIQDSSVNLFLPTPQVTVLAFIRHQLQVDFCPPTPPPQNA